MALEMNDKLAVRSSQPAAVVVRPAQSRPSLFGSD